MSGSMNCKTIDCNHKYYSECIQNQLDKYSLCVENATQEQPTIYMDLRGKFSSIHPKHLNQLSSDTNIFCVKRSSVLKRARELTSCASCLNSVRTLRLNNHPLLEDDKKNDVLRLRDVHIKTIESTSKVLTMYSSTSGEWLTNLQPQSSKKKKGIRCKAHASTRKYLRQSKWEIIWNQAPRDFQEKVASMVPSEFKQFVKEHCDFVGFCKLCTQNVKEGYHLLMLSGDDYFDPPKNYDESVFAPLSVLPLLNANGQPIRSCMDVDKKIVCEISSVPDLINYHITEIHRDELRKANNQDARCAPTLYLVQQEILNVVGSLLLHRIQSLWYPYNAEKQSIGLISRLTLSCIYINVKEFLDKRMNGKDNADDDVNSKNNKKKKSKNSKKGKKKKSLKKKNRPNKISTAATKDNIIHDTEEVELLTSMGWIPAAPIEEKDKQQQHYEDDYDLGLSEEEFKSMKAKLMELKNERIQKRVELKHAWEQKCQQSCQLSCCTGTDESKRAPIPPIIDISESVLARSGHICTYNMAFTCLLDDAYI